MDKNIELKATVIKQRFYNGASMWGVYVFEPTQQDMRKVDLSYNGDFAVSGNCPELFVGKTYDIVIEPSEHPKYGKGYSFVAIKQKKPTSVDEQQAYLRAMLKEKQAEAIIEKYPNHLILDMMKDDTFDYSDIKGIGKPTYDKIKKYLFANLDIQEALVELSELNITFKAMKKLIDHFGDASVVIQKVRNNIYNLCEVSSFGFLKVDQYALNRGDDKENRNRIIAALKYVLDEEAMYGHSWCSVQGLTDKAKELLQIDKRLIHNAIDYVEENDDSFYISGDQIAIKKNYNFEKKSYEYLMDMLNGKVKTKVDNVDERIKQLEDASGFQYTDEQKNAIREAVNNNLLVINGKGGTGKSFTVKGILNVLSNYSYVCCALSGKAAKILEDHGLNSMTIHRMLGVEGNGQFLYKRGNPMPYDIIVLDEASMVNSQLFYSVLSAIKDGGKLIIVGDSGQLPAIGTASIFEDILKSNKLPRQELTIVQRQAQKSGILSTANEIRDGRQINERYNYENKVVGELKDFVLLPVQNKENIQSIILDICNKYKDKDLNEFQVLTGLKSRGDLSVKKLNLELQKIFNDVSKPFVKRGGYEYRTGDKIIQCGNNYDAGEKGEFSIFNGTLGMIEKIDFNKKDESKNVVWIKFDNIDELIPYSRDLLDSIELAYAITVHRSQGSTIKHILFAFDYASYMLLSRQFVYTGITRASKGCVVVCENAALHHAIKTDHSGVRRTFLYDMLMG
ncbi:AAA family ATPase [uncultured Metabacillus sp.]|nr:AAA family ATPase [uncultured Metabacillus sp.]